MIHLLQENNLGNWSNVATIVVPILMIISGLWAFYTFVKKQKKIKLDALRVAKRNKQKELRGAYKELLRIINLFPNRTPYDVMTLLPYGPSFNLENFETVNTTLEIQIKEDYLRRLGREGLTYQDEEDIKTEIRNREYYIKEITTIKNKYFNAKQEYEQFRNNDKTIDLFSSQEVKTCLVEFEVVVRNAFITGRALEYNDGRNNKLDNVRWKLEQLIRDDIGVL